MPIRFEEARRALLGRKAALQRPAKEVAAESDRSGELLEIEAALQRIQLGTWGRCEACQRAIGRQRLLALPETRRCASCNLELEPGGRHS